MVFAQRGYRSSTQGFNSGNYPIKRLAMLWGQSYEDQSITRRLFQNEDKFPLAQL